MVKALTFPWYFDSPHEAIQDKTDSGAALVLLKAILLIRICYRLCAR